MGALWLILKMIYRLLIVVASLFFTGCGNQEVHPPMSASDTSTTGLTNDTAFVPQVYFPIRDYILGEIASADSMPVGIMKFTTIGKRKDSGYIKSDEFHRLASEFLSPELEDSLFKKEFEETSFFDKTTNTSTFFYSTKNPALSLRRVDIILTKGEIYDDIKSIYLEKSFKQGDIPTIKKLYWKPKRNFQIITQSSKGSGEPLTELVKVEWDNRE